MLNSSIIVQPSGISGKGLFAQALIRAGEVVWRQDPHEEIYSLEVIRSWPAEIQRKFWHYASQVDDGRFRGPKSGTAEDPAEYMNHSCDPNTWFADDATMVARRDIQPGAEITYDYATSETTETWFMHCRCGTPICRKVVRGTDWRMNPGIRDHYGRHATSQVLKLV